MELEEIIQDWISVSNSYNTEKYLTFYTNNAVLDDVSVGKKFIGKAGLKEYFERYFIGYKTQTKVVNLVKETVNKASLEVEFMGDFPEGTVRGSFDLIFKEGKIAFLAADLLY
jgi:hypothetical protein